MIVPFCGLYLGSYKVIPKKELLWSLWAGFKAQGLGFRDQGTGCQGPAEVWGSGLRVQGYGFSFCKILPVFYSLCVCVYIWRVGGGGGCSGLGVLQGVGV